MKEHVAQGFADLVGHTPLVRLRRIEEAEGLETRLIAKLERTNPAGSAKDRIALAMIREAEAQGQCRKGTVIIEPTSGNTGVALAAVGAALGYRVIITMPDSMSLERRKLIRVYGAEIVLTPGALGIKGAVDKAREIAATFPSSFIPDQFGNPANPRAHYETTGPEIWHDAAGRIDAFVAGIGTGGTLSGVGKYLKGRDKAIQVIGLEPLSSPLLSRGHAGAHGIQGIGANFIPATLDQSVMDRIVTVSTEDAYAYAKALAREEGLLVGISAGAALAAGVALAREEAYRGKTIVMLFTDGGDRYYSTALFPTD